MEKKLKAGFIGFMPQDGDPYEALESYAKMGYSVFEGADLLLREGDPAENLARVRSFGMEPLAVHYDYNNPPTVAEIVDRAKKTQVRRAACYMASAGCYRFAMRPTPPDYDAMMKECEALDQVAEELAKEGIDFMFHNHDAEFDQCVNGVPVLYFMAAHTRSLKFQVDCGWVTYAGYDPVRVLKSLGQRVSAVHIKDFIPGAPVPVKEKDGREYAMPHFTAPGTGVLKLRECLETAIALGVESVSVEQDFPNILSNPEILQAAYLNLKETGLVE